MSFLYVSEAIENNDNILYIRESLSELFFKNGSDRIISDNNRAELILNIEDNIKTVAFEELSDKISDVIAVGYKYKFFNEHIKISGLNGILREFLLASLISADLDDDKHYICSKISPSKEYAIDGIFNFKISRLKNKWAEIITYIPSYFSIAELKEFIMYLLNEKQGKTIVIDGNKVFDKRYNRLKRVMLLPVNNVDLKADVFKEVLLSGAGKVYIKKSPPPFDEKYLKEYFGEKILFNTGKNL